TYSWNFGDGSSATGQTVSHTYTAKGVYTATLTVTDSEGEMSEAAVVEVVVGNTVPSPEIVWPAPGAMTEPGRTLTLEGQAMDPEDGMLSGEALQWTVTAHYLEDGAERSEELAAFTGASGDVDIPEDLDWHGDVRYLVSLTATDSGGLSDSVENVVRYTRLQAQSYDVVSGFNPVSTSDEDGEQDLQARTAGDYFAWQGVNLTGRNPAFIRVAPGTTGGTLELRLGSNQGELLGTVEVAADDEDAWETVAIPLEGAEGVHDLYLVAGAEGGAEDGGEVDLRVNWVQLVGPGVPRE
ncbi:MAG: PKD domain-containing protein, partial [Deinococcota bacterium]|nr:PKD domain-containing protein [Deinococcota bacterium]